MNRVDFIFWTSQLALCTMSLAFLIKSKPLSKERGMGAVVLLAAATMFGLWTFPEFIGVITGVAK